MSTGFMSGFSICQSSNEKSYVLNLVFEDDETCNGESPAENVLFRYRNIHAFCNKVSRILHWNPYIKLPKPSHFLQIEYNLQNCIARSKKVSFLREGVNF